jgi:hypothetical protein
MLEQRHLKNNLNEFFTVRCFWKSQSRVLIWMLSIHHNFGCHLWVYRAVILVRAGLCESKRKMVIRIESLRLENLLIAGDHVGNIVMVRPRNRRSGRNV